MESYKERQMEAFKKKHPNWKQEADERKKEFQLKRASEKSAIIESMELTVRNIESLIYKLPAKSADQITLETWLGKTRNALTIARERLK